MSEKNKKTKQITFWIDEELFDKYSKMYFDKSYFLRNCMQKAVEDINFYLDVSLGYGVYAERPE